MTRKKADVDLEAYDSGAVIGSAEAMERLLREAPDGPVPEDAEGRFLLQLVRLHPELKMKLRATEIDALTDQEKRTIIEDIQGMLGIKPLRTGRP